MTLVLIANLLHRCKSVHGDIIKQLDLRPLMVSLTLSTGTSVLCLACPFLMSDQSVKFDKVCFDTFLSNCRCNLTSDSRL